jgi:hypothetical protein
MSEFKSWQGFSHFAEAVTERTRFVHDQETSAFLETVCATAAERVRHIAAGTTFWRAQIGRDWTSFPSRAVYFVEPGPLHPDRMKPRPGLAREGRANPKGIPVLYLAGNPDTAIAEVRPWLGAHVSVGRFRVKHDLQIVDCGADPPEHAMYLEEPAPDVREAWVWMNINVAFSRPVAASDEEADYVPTQILAELFRVKGYDGIKYGSAFGSDFSSQNVALFDLDSADLVECLVYQVEEIMFRSRLTGPSYCVEEKSDKSAGSGA